MIDYLLSPKAIRERTARLFELTREGKTHFNFHEERLPALVKFVCEVIKDNYPDLKIPYHSRWGHFKAGRPERLDEYFDKQSGDALEKARTDFELVITSVLLDAGAGPTWKYKEQSGQEFARSEGLAVASFYQFLNGDFSSDSNQKLRGDADGLKSYSADILAQGFQVSEDNPLVGLEGRAQLIRSLGEVVEKNSKYFPGQRIGGLVDYLQTEHGQKIEAADVLKAVLLGLGEIWPGRLTLEGVNLGDVWSHPLLGEGTDGYVPFHKLSQWLTYSLIEPLERAGFEIVNLDGMTGLPEYRNGGLFVDLEVLTLKDAALLEKAHKPDSELIVEWRALTVQLLDQVAGLVRNELGFSEDEFPLAKVLEGGTWWAGRRVAKEKRADGTPPIKIDSDGTVF